MRIVANEVMGAIDETVANIVRMAMALIEAEIPHHRPAGGPPPPLREGG
jgi:hypothetical protein